MARVYHASGDRLSRDFGLVGFEIDYVAVKLARGADHVRLTAYGGGATDLTPIGWACESQRSGPARR